MFDVLDRQTRLTGNQKKIIAAAVIGDALEFFDYFLIGYVLAFVIGPWKLTFGQSAIVLLSSGVGAIIGAYVWGWIADRIGRRAVFIGTVLNFSVATGLLYFTPDNGWIYLTIMRFFVGLGVGGLYCVDLPLVQEFMPSSKRGFVGGLVTAVIPLGVGMGAVLAGFMGADQWRLLFAIGLLPALIVLLIRVWVPESPHWLARQGRLKEARESLAWALQVPAESLPLPAGAPASQSKLAPQASWFELFKYPRSLLVSWLGNAGAQTGAYGVALWAPALFVLLLKVTPQEAAKMMILLSVTGFIGRLSFALAQRAHWPAQLRRSAGLRCRHPDHHGRLQLQRHGVRLVGVLVDPGGGDVLRRRRLRHRRALCCRGLAVASQDHRHGLGVRLRRHRQDHRSGRPGVDRGLQQLPQARRAVAPVPDRIPVSRLLVPDGGRGLLFLRVGDQGQVDAADRPRIGRSRLIRETNGPWIR
jgi:MFS family permease